MDVSVFSRKLYTPSYSQPSELVISKKIPDYFFSSKSRKKLNFRFFFRIWFQAVMLKGSSTFASFVTLSLTSLGSEDEWGVRFALRYNPASNSGKLFENDQNVRKF